MAAGISMMASPAMAGNIFSVDFGTSFPDEAYGYGWSEHQTHAGISSGVAPEAGIGGTGAYQEVLNFDGAGAWGGGAIEIHQHGPVVPFAPQDVSDLYFSFDIQVIGVPNDGVNTTEVSLAFNFRDGNGDTVLGYGPDVQYDVNAGGYQHFSGNFAADDDLNGSLEDFVQQMNELAELRTIFTFNGAAADFDRSADISLFVDNVQVGVIPEPASLGLLGAGGLMMLLRRRRKQ